MRLNFPTSKWQKAHYSWYKSQINTGRINLSNHCDLVNASEAGIEENISQSIDTQVSLEKDLQQYLVSRVGELEEDLMLIEGGVEYAIEAGRIDLLAKDKDDHLVVRTFERGVENLTLSCGTGVVASAIVAAERSAEMFDNYRIKTDGNDELTIPSSSI